MGESALVESRIVDAHALIQELDRANTGPAVAAWYFYFDAGQWRLVMGGPNFDPLLPKQEPIAYRRIVDALANIPSSVLAISDVKLIRSDSQLAKAFQLIIRTPPDALVRAYCSDTTINGVFIKEMVILRASG